MYIYLGCELDGPSKLPMEKKNTQKNKLNFCDAMERNPGKKGQISSILHNACITWKKKQLVVVSKTPFT